MDVKEIVLLKYGELALKGANRGLFESILVKNIKRKLSGLGTFSVVRAQSTITVTPTDEGVNMDEVFDRMKKVFGIAALSRSVVVKKEMDAIYEGVAYLDDELSQVKTFKVNARRSDKAFPLGSPEISAEVGHYILERHPHLQVDLHNPELVVMVEVRDRAAFIHAGQHQGAGGIPVSTGGRAMLLLSGGIDSPVAGAMMAKRGLEISAVHFESPPYTSERAKMKVFELCRRMAAYTGRIKLTVVPFTEIQEEIAKVCPEEYFTVIMRRFMMEMAADIAKKDSCEALITGESLGQVASQTVQAIACTDAAATLPVMRPLIGMDKEEIVTIARKIDTFETSILPYEDCCTVFTPRYPKTRPQLQMVIQAEEKLDRKKLSEDACQKIAVCYIDCDSSF